MRVVPVMHALFVRVLSNLQVDRFAIVEIENNYWFVSIGVCIQGNEVYFPEILLPSLCNRLDACGWNWCPIHLLWRQGRLWTPVWLGFERALTQDLWIGCTFINVRVSRTGFLRLSILRMWVLRLVVLRICVLRMRVLRIRVLRIWFFGRARN